MRYGQARKLGKGDGHDDKVNPSETKSKSQKAEKKGDGYRNKSSHKHADPGRQSDSLGQKGGGVSSDADIKRMAQGYVPGISGQHIPGLADVGPEKDHYKYTQGVIAQEKGKQH